MSADKCPSPLGVRTTPVTTAMGVSSLYLDFLYDPKKVQAYFGRANHAAVISNIRSSHYDRDMISDIFFRQNKAWDCPRAVIDQIEKLRHPDAVAILTGQQPCLFGGPYLILLKALAAVKWARLLELQHHVPVVPIFWISADDHDFKEISFVDIFDRGGALSRLAIDIPGRKVFPPLGTMSYDPSIERELNRLSELLPDNEFKQGMLAPLASIFQTGKPVVDSFAKDLHSLIGSTGLIIFNPYDAQVKSATADFMASLVRRRGEVREVLSARESKLDRAGYALQVQKAPTALHLFYHAPARLPLHEIDGVIRAGQKRFTESELIAAVHAKPLDFSPDVLLRPLMQSILFPAVAVIGGPAEIAYFGQLLPLFDLFRLPAPVITARPSATILERRFDQLMARRQITYADLTGDVETLITRLMVEDFPKELQRELNEIGDNSKASFERLKAALVAFDPALDGMAAQTSERIDYQIKELAKKVFAAHKKRKASDREALYRLHQHLFPNHAPAERSIALAYFISRYGPKIVDFVMERLQLDETDHQFLPLSEYHG